MFNATNLKKPIPFTILNLICSLLSLALILGVALVFKKHALDVLAPMLGPLFAGNIYAGITKEMSSLKLRVIAAIGNSVFMYALMNVLVLMLKNKTYEFNPKQVAVSLTIFILGSLFMLYLGNRNKLKTMEYRNNIKDRG